MTWVYQTRTITSSGSDSFHRYFRMSVEQFDYVLGLVGPHILRLPTVYLVVYVQGRTTSYGVVRGRTISYVVVLIEHVQSIGRIHSTRDVVRRYDAIRRETQKSRHARFLRTFVRTTSYDVVRPCTCTATYTVGRRKMCGLTSPRTQSNCSVDIRKYPWKLSLPSRSSCTSLAYSAKSSRRRSTSWTQKRRSRVYFDKKICQTREDNYYKPKRHRERRPQSLFCYLYALICIIYVVVRRRTTSDDHHGRTTSRTTSYAVWTPFMSRRRLPSHHPVLR